MKKFLAIFLALVLTMALLAGCAAKPATEAGQTAKTAETVKIVLLLPGEVNDQGWNASNYAGVVACNEKLGTKMEYVEAVQEADFESTFREYAERGYDIIMAAGSQFDEAASSVAANYPNTLFMVVNGAKCDKANLCPLFPKEYEASTKYVNENNADAAQLIEKFDIVKAAVAEKALPYCNITCIAGADMKAPMDGYLKVLFDQNPASVGGTLPDSDFYYEG